MGFFKDFKDDFSEAINDILPPDEPLGSLDEKEAADAGMAADTGFDQAGLDSLFDQVEAGVDAVPVMPEEDSGRDPALSALLGQLEIEDINSQNKVVDEFADAAESVSSVAGNTAAPVEVQPEFVETTEKPVENAVHISNDITGTVKEDKNMEVLRTKTTTVTQRSAEEEIEAAMLTDEVTVITEGTRITGNIESSGNLVIDGTIIGDVQCNGKLTVSGHVKGNINVNEFFADASKIEGEINATGAVKVGMGAVIIGNISSTQAVVAGAIKGDVDVQGPVVVDNGAVIVGNIKSRSVQINTGAVIEGFCSQCYSDVDMDSLFGKLK